MNCSNCGTLNEKETKFCVNCGKELEKKGEGLGVASMVIGIISLILTFILTVITLPLSLTGLILGIVNKAKGGKKISGIILNAISIFLSIVLIFVYLFIGIGIFSAIISDPDVRNELKKGVEDIEREFDRETSLNYVEGEYNCKSFDGNGVKGDYIVRFELDDDMSFMWGKYGDTYNNYVKGTYTFEDLDKKNAAGNYSYYTVTLDGDVFYEDGVKQTKEYASEYEFGITKENGKKQGIIMNTKTYNMYYCFEE